MLKWALIFFVVSLITGFLGFSGVSAATASIAKILFSSSPSRSSSSSWCLPSWPAPP